MTKRVFQPRYYIFLILLVVVVIASFNALISLPNTRFCPSERQLPRSIAIAYDALGSSRYIWVSANGYSTLATVRDSGRFTLKKGHLSKAQWREVSRSIPRDFFLQPRDFFRQNLNEGAAFEEWEAVFSIHNGSESRALVVHPYHFRFGVLKALNTELNLTADRQVTEEAGEEGFLLKPAWQESGAPQYPPAELNALLSDAAKRPCCWTEVSKSQISVLRKLDENAVLRIDGCDYYLVLLSSEQMNQGS